MSSVYFNPAVKEMLDTILLPIEIVSPGKMFGYPAYFIGKKLFACVYEDAVGIKLPLEKASFLIGQPGITPFVPMGRHRMKEWVQITRANPADYPSDRAIFDLSIEYVASLPQ
jgi:hypothetical protein